jgi:hypothetical protein
MRLAEFLALTDIQNRPDYRKHVSLRIMLEARLYNDPDAGEATLATG